MKLSLFTDGGSRGNPGPAAIGVVVGRESPDDNVHVDGKGYVNVSRSMRVVKESARCIGSTTNNVAEYHALIEGLELCKELGATWIDCYSDSELLVNQMSHKWRVRKRHLRVLWLKACSLSSKFSTVKFHWVSRVHPWIQRADELLNEELDK